MKIQLISNLLFSAFVVLGLAACDKKEEIKVLEAMQDFPIYEMSVGKALLAKQKMLESKGVTTELQWTYQIAQQSEEEAIDEPQAIKVTAEMKILQGRGRNETYTWDLFKNPNKSMAKKGSVWDMKPTNRNARSLMHINREKLAQWASFLIPVKTQPTKISQKKK